MTPLLALYDSKYALVSSENVHGSCFRLIEGGFDEKRKWLFDHYRLIGSYSINVAEGSDVLIAMHNILNKRASIEASNI